MRQSFLAQYITCSACNGEGRKNYRKCNSCRGAGRHPHVEPEERYAVTLPEKQS